MAFLNGTDPSLRQVRTPTVDTYTAGAQFTAGSSTQVSLSSDPGTENNVIITFDGITQHRDTYAISGTTVTFDAAIATGVSKVEATYTTTIPAHEPADNSVTLAKIVDGSVSAAKLASGLGFGFTSMQVFTSSGTWTRPTGITLVKVIVVGGGGGGGGCVSPSTYNPGSAGGGGGGTAIEVIDVSSTSSAAVTVGAGGAAGAAGSNNGAAGGTSSFASFCSATGGGGGDFGADAARSTIHDGGAGGAGSGGNVNIDGSAGGDANSDSGSARFCGSGGGSFIGPGADRPIAEQAAVAASAYGGGGSGLSKGNTAGGAGKAGIVIVEEYK